ncbi:argininosuccinate lyase [Longispora fulva]|uniref:Argininosuccinate lyase n=1 Tax=Longispora fulva TaxID=619741 RepID=A0A8J7GPM1_9ACTN|nr:ATP-grasp domain-containing protein [Longispora fulva]MBG6135598.1 argininosuccinate lyase [Longispora fulva]GIG56163.1 argininosuccinate lyase [Longispora fulva]
MTDWFVLVESNTTGTGRLFAHAARDLGTRPVLLARDPARYPYVAADGLDHRVVDTADPAAVRAACLALGGRIIGVTSSSEYFVATAAEVARDLDLPHPDPDAVRDCRDKPTQRRTLRDKGVPGPLFGDARTSDEAVSVAGAIGCPVVVKPAAGSGSIGVRLCADPDEVHAAAEAVLGALPGLPPQGAVLVEEYLDGPEYSVETLDEHVVGVTRKHLGPHPYFVETGHDFPAPVGQPLTTSLADAAIAALRALGLGWGPAHVELRHTRRGPCVVEVNPRLAGGMIPRVVQESCGVDMIAQVVARVAGRRPDPAPSRARPASIRFLVAARAGTLTGIGGVDAARAVPGVVEVGVLREPGDLVLRHSFQDRLGYVIATGPAAALAADAGLRALDPRITP